MKTALLLYSGAALMAAAVAPSVARAGDDTDWASRSPLAFGEPMEDCDQYHPAMVAREAPVPVIAPAATDPAPAPVKQEPPKKQLSASQLSTRTLFTLALIAAPGSQLPVPPK